MLFFRRPAYVPEEEWQKATKQWKRLFIEGLLMGGTGLGVLALISEIAADAFSVAAYQTLLALYGAHGYHWIAIAAFAVLSVMLFFGVVPSYQAASYLRPNIGGSGPLVESIAPKKMRWLSWVGTSLFFIDAVLTIIISTISAADVLMLLVPQWAPYRLPLAMGFAFLVMVLLYKGGPRRAVVVFLIGGAAFTLFTLVALLVTGIAALLYPEWGFLTAGIVHRLEVTQVVIETVAPQMGTLSLAVIALLFFRSMSSAMLGFSGYEVIPASGKHAAKPKWFVVRYALTLAALFLILTGIFQLFAAQRWRIPATEGYSTLLIEYEIVATQLLGRGVDPDDVQVQPEDLAWAAQRWETLTPEERSRWPNREAFLEEAAYNNALARAIDQALRNTWGQWLLYAAGLLLVVILLLAQGGGYVGGAAVAANAARLGRLPGWFLNDRNGVLTIGGIAMLLIPVIRFVTVVEAYYAFGFVTAFVISSMAVAWVRDDVLRQAGIDPDSEAARAIRWAGRRGFIASTIMLLVLVFTKTHALIAITLVGALITALQVWTYRRGLQNRSLEELKAEIVQRGGLRDPEVAEHLGTISLKQVIEEKYNSNLERALDEARQRGIAKALEEILKERRIEISRLNVDNDRIRRLIATVYRVHPKFLNFEHPIAELQPDAWAVHDEFQDEPSPDLLEVRDLAYARKEEILETLQFFSQFGIFTFIRNYYENWVSPEKGRPTEIVQQAMLKVLFPHRKFEEVWEEFQNYHYEQLSNDLWQFARERYRWAKNQWPNLSASLTTIWTLQDHGLIPPTEVVTIPVKFSSQAEREVTIYTNLAALPEDPRGDAFVAYMRKKYAWVWRKHSSQRSPSSQPSPGGSD